MNEVLHLLKELLKKLDETTPMNLETLIDAKNQLNLYVQKFFSSNKEYSLVLKNIDSKPSYPNAYRNSVSEFKSLINTLIQDIQLSNNDINIDTEDQRNEILSNARKEIEVERERIQNDAREIRQIKEQLLNEREQLLAEENKFNDFKAKLEIADKELDFQFEAVKNKKTANIWALFSGILIILLITVLFKSLDTNNSLSKIAEVIKSDMKISEGKIDSLVSTTIYFSYSKFLFTKILLYSLIIYAITFCVKNYNAQMHNHIINMHKANAFKSTLSLLNTAKSEDGNDKLLIQATQAIFSHQQTGYSGKESEPTSPNVVTNVIDAAAKKI